MANDNDKSYIIRDKDGEIISDRFYARSEEEALRIAKSVYRDAAIAERLIYRKEK